MLEFYSGKQERLRAADGGRCVGHMFALRVEEELSVWAEGEERKRRWLLPQEGNSTSTLKPLTSSCWEALTSYVGFTSPHLTSPES